MPAAGSAQTNGSTNLEMMQSNQDLIITKGNKKKRTWIITGVVAVIVIALIIAAIVLLTKSDDSKSNDPPLAALDLEDIIYGRVNSNSFNATWISGDELLFLDESNNLVIEKLDAKTKNTKRSILIPSGNQVMTGHLDYELSNDRKYIKIGHSYQKRYRYSYKAKYTVIDLETESEYPISINNRTDFFLAVWMPNSNGLVLVIDGNIFYKESPTTAEFTKLTSSDDPSRLVYNGVPDWVYEEEVFSSNRALWLPADGQHMAYAQFDDTDVESMVLPIYGAPLNANFQYPRAQLIKYPKVGTRNPTVALFVHAFNGGPSARLEVPAGVAGQQPILASVAWATNEELVAIWMNRIQNHAVIVSYVVGVGPVQVKIIKEIEQQNGWLELFTPPIFSEDGRRFVLILSHNDFRHITSLNLETDSPATPLTDGSYVVTEILAWRNGTIHYLANTELDYGLQHLYELDVQTKTTKCMSCNLTAQPNCLYNTAEFSKDSSHFALTCAGPQVPSIAIYATSSAEKLLEWENNQELRDLIKEKQIPSIKRLKFPVDGGFMAEVMLRLPPNFDSSGKTKYPMLVNVYAGPDSFQVVEKFNLDWGSYLTANKSIIYATIDGRGSGLKGDRILFALYKNLGSVEIIDQINVTRQIHATLPYVDASRTAIWGWSYGGYASAMVLATDTEGVFKCGISVAPVTDWKLYDSIYTERFMVLPKDNEIGYSSSTLLHRPNDLRDKEYFLIHGTFDDNVHYQQSMVWAKALELSDVLFQQLSYPDEDHGLVSVRPHLYHSLENFLDGCFIQRSEN